MAALLHTWDTISSSVIGEAAVFVDFPGFCPSVSAVVVTGILSRGVILPAGPAIMRRWLASESPRPNDRAVPVQRGACDVGECLILVHLVRWRLRRNWLLYTWLPTWSSPAALLPRAVQSKGCSAGTRLEFPKRASKFIYEVS